MNNFTQQKHWLHLLYSHNYKLPHKISDFKTNMLNNFSTKGEWIKIQVQQRHVLLF